MTEIGAALGLAAVGIFLSAFFSGTETGFYRATRVRLVLVPGASHLSVGAAEGVPALIDRWFDEHL